MHTEDSWERLRQRVTELETVEREMVETQSLLRTVIDESPDLIVLKDHQGNFLLANQPVATFYGTTPDEMVGKHDGDFSASPEQAEFFRQNVLAIMARGETEVVLESSTDDATGEVRHFKSIKKPFRGPDGQMRILVIAHDITDILSAQKKLEYSEHLMRNVLETIGAGIWDWHLPTGKLTHNALWYEMLGYSPDDLSGTVADFERCLHPDDAPFVKRAIEQALTNGSTYLHEHRMVRKDGQVIWVKDRGRVIERAEDGSALRMIGCFADISTRKRAEHEIHRLAFYDPLTKLPNLRMLKERLDKLLARCRQEQAQSYLLFIDVDHFKELNDIHGHSAGDVLLQQLADGLQMVVGPGGTVARFGGDEFVIIADGLHETQADAADAASAMVSRIRGLCDEPFLLGADEFQTSLSVGVTLVGSQSADVDEVLRQADLAMYQAKGAGRNTFQFFDPQIRRALEERTSLQNDIRRALLGHEFVNHYQPVVDALGNWVSLEALVRWQHPTRGLLTPGAFIEVAEHSGQILDIGHQVLWQACRLLAAWRNVEGRQHLQVAVNVSVRQFLEPDFVGRVLDAIETTGAPANRLKLEITESLLLKGMGKAIDRMLILQEAGVKFSIDDFGTGYSSLSYLQRLPIDELKIDQSFVSEILKPSGEAIVKTILALAQTLQLAVVAEGVETVEQFELLRQHGCRTFQGYLFGKPQLLEV